MNLLNTGVMNRIRWLLNNLKAMGGISSIPRFELFYCLLTSLPMGTSRILLDSYPGKGLTGGESLGGPSSSDLS